MRSRCALLNAVLVMAAFAAPALAEVSAKTDAGGNYRCMLYRYSTYTGRARVWSMAGLSGGRYALNPGGDNIGDMAPTVAENPARRNWPLVVWPRSVSGNFDLVYSLWNGRGWTATQVVHPNNSFHDLEPRLAFNSEGQAYMVWWGDESGVGAVYFSVLGESTWLAPYRISQSGTDSRHPDLVLEDDSTIHVTYNTPQGAVTRSIRIERRDTITDDIDPKLQFVISVSN